jgi:hypothetical protein
VWQKGAAPDKFLFTQRGYLLDCKRRWELAAGTQERPSTLMNEITKRLRMLLRKF